MIKTAAICIALLFGIMVNQPAGTCIEKGANGKITIKDSIPKIINETEGTEERAYLYAFPVFPQPASEIARSKVYWDPEYEMLIENIGIYDITGSKQPGNGLSLDKTGSYYGILTWDCSKARPGVYFIHIWHGNRDWILKRL